MHMPKRFSISKCLSRRRAMLDARFSPIGLFLPEIAHIAARFAAIAYLLVVIL